MAQRGDDEKAEKEKKGLSHSHTPLWWSRFVIGVARSVKFKLFAGETEISETRFSGFAKERCIELMKLNGCKEWNYNDSANVLYWRASLKYLLVNKN